MEHNLTKKWAFAVMPNYLACLVIAGNKTATCSGHIFYTFDGQELPQLNDEAIILDHNNNPLVTITITSVEQCAFGQVSEAFALAEGEEDYTHWYQSHEQFFNTQLFTLDQALLADCVGVKEKKVTSDFKVICERFTVVDVQAKSYAEWLAFAEKVLLEALDSDPYLNVKSDINILLSFVTGRSKASIMAFSETLLTPDELIQLAKLLVRRAQGEPIAYILGEKEFWSLPLKVSRDTLIPRPDTEILVEKALELAKLRLNLPHFTGELAILDLGTGTGAIALALAFELAPLAQKCGANLKIFGVDRIAQAVELAKQNAALNHLDVTFLQSSWFAALDLQMKFDVIVSNPPYIDEKDPHLMQGGVRFEPLSALVAEEQGYADLRHIVTHASCFLKAGGYLLLEHGWQQGQKVRSIFKENQWQDVTTVQDYAGNDRVTLARWRG
ncbi:peptide chain release factor N(5)-glutamine methyltransferase [Pasteurella oralis]|uniref:peptide chain release factor N(5)-glutamine methyltransferase n=1 Tax=Pasteurella oralis TaxID=1071947 RepID=UPI003183A399